MLPTEVLRRRALERRAYRGFLARFADLVGFAALVGLAALAGFAALADLTGVANSTGATGVDGLCTCWGRTSV